MIAKLQGLNDAYRYLTGFYTTLLKMRRGSSRTSST